MQYRLYHFPIDSVKKGKSQYVAENKNGRFLILLCVAEFFVSWTYTKNWTKIYEKNIIQNITTRINVLSKFDIVTPR